MDGKIHVDDKVYVELMATLGLRRSEVDSINSAASNAVEECHRSIVDEAVKPLIDSVEYSE